MNLEKRINRLESKISKMYSDPNAEAVLKEWFKLNPGYLVFAQPESNNGVVIPEHLRHAFFQIINRTFDERNLHPNCYNLLQILDDLSEKFDGLVIF